MTTAITVEQLQLKRKDGFLRVSQNVMGTSLAAAVPTPALQVAKMLGIAAADAWMFWDIYRIYYEQRLSAQKLRDLLGDAGIIIFSGGVVSYSALKISQGIIAEFLDIVPIAGWVVNGLITGTSSLTLGLAWMTFVENAYRAEYGLQKLKPAEAEPKSAPKRKIEIKTGNDIKTESNGHQPVEANGALHVEPDAVTAPEVEAAALVAAEPIVETAEPIVETVEPVVEIEVEQPAAAIEPEAVEIAAPAVEADDLTQIDGIGPKSRDILIAAGIVTYAQLAELSVEQLETIIKAGGMRRPANLATWPEQASYAARGDWDALKAFVG